MRKCINEFIKKQEDKKSASKKAKEIKDDCLAILKECSTKVKLSDDLIQILTYSEDISKIIETFN